MSFDPESARELSEGAAAVTAIGAAMVILWRVWLGIKRRSCAGYRWAGDWLAMPGHVAHLADTTERRFEAVESELAMHGTHLSMALDGGGYVHWRTDSQGNMIQASPDYFRVFLTTEDEAYGRGWISLVHPEDYDRGVEGFFLCVGDRRTWEMQCRMRGNGGWVLCDHYARPVMAGGRCIGYAGRSKQITGPT